MIDTRLLVKNKSVHKITFKVHTKILYNHFPFYCGGVYICLLNITLIHRSSWAVQFAEFRSNRFTVWRPI